MVDYYAAALVAAGVASALFERERSGQGQFVGVSLLRSALTMQPALMVWAQPRFAFDARRVSVSFSEHGAFLESTVREDRPHRSRERRALRHCPQARTA